VTLFLSIPSALPVVGAAKGMSKWLESKIYEQNNETLALTKRKTTLAYFIHYHYTPPRKRGRGTTRSVVEGARADPI
jgi:hypothetical protein